MWIRYAGSWNVDAVTAQKIVVTGHKCYVCCDFLRGCYVIVSFDILNIFVFGGYQLNRSIWAPSFPAKILTGLFENQAEF